MKYDEELIIRLYRDEKKSAKEISAVIGCVQNTILRILRKNNVELNDQKLYWTKERREAQRRLCMDGVIGVHASRKYSMTNIEIAFAKWAAANKIEIVSQFQFRKGTHRYDFRLTGTNIIVETDGLIWHSTDKQKKNDRRYEKYAEDFGFKVIRFTDKEIIDNPNCFDSLIDVIKSSTIDDERSSALVDSDHFEVILRAPKPRIKREPKPRKPHSEETKAKIRASVSASAHLISAANKGKPKSESTREKMSLAAKGVRKSEDHKRNMSESRLAANREKYGDIEKIDPKTGEVVNRYVHLSDCGIRSYSNIFGAIDTEKIRYGYKWRRAID